MKSILLLSTLTFSIICLGQKVSKETLKHTYYQTPKVYLSKDKKVKKEVKLTYLEKNTSIKNNIDDINKSNDERAQKELENYENKKTSQKVVNKLLLGEKKPTGDGKNVDLPFLQKEWGSTEILEGACKTENLLESQDATARIEISVLEFITTEKNTERYPSSGTQYSFNVEGSAGLRLDCYNENNDLVFSKSTAYNYNKTGKSYSSSYERDKNYNKGVKDLKVEVEKRCMSHDLKEMQKIVTDNIDYSMIEKKTFIYTINDKKNNYTEINKCLVDFSKGLQYFSTEETFSRGKDIIRNIVSIYEAELKEYNPNDKKARINSTIAHALYINLCNAYIYINEYEKAKECIIQCKIINPKKSGKELEKLKLFLEDHKARYEAIK